MIIEAIPMLVSGEVDALQHPHRGARLFELRDRIAVSKLVSV